MKTKKQSKTALSDLALIDDLIIITKPECIKGAKLPKTKEQNIKALIDIINQALNASFELSLAKSSTISDLKYIVKDFLENGNPEEDLYYSDFSDDYDLDYEFDV